MRINHWGYCAINMLHLPNSNLASAKFYTTCATLTTETPVLLNRWKFASVNAPGTVSHFSFRSFWSKRYRNWFSMSITSDSRMRRTTRSGYSFVDRSEEHTSELQSRQYLVC